MHVAIALGIGGQVIAQARGVEAAGAEAAGAGEAAKCNFIVGFVEFDIVEFVGVVLVAPNWCN